MKLNKYDYLVAVFFTCMLLAMTGCGKQDEVQDIAQAPACVVKATATGGVINCPDGSSTAFTNGVNGLPGQVGATGAQGEQGVAGQNGTNGANGINGTNGKDASPITFVQFCPNSGPPVYPSTFPEFGIEQNGVIYGVYSTNGGFLAQLPPGYYNSNAVGSTCNFTINQDGTITQD